MLLAQVESFLVVARTGNLSRAAEQLYLTQPTLTARLKALETEVGQDLFVRTARGVRLTEAGREFLPYAERATSALREGREHLEELRRGVQGTLAVGASPGVSTYLLPTLLERFAALHPSIVISVRTGHSEEVLDLVLNEEVHVGLGRVLRHPAIHATPLYEDELVLVVHPDHRFAHQPCVPVPELAQERMILFDRTSSYYDLTQALFLQAGIVPASVMELDNIEAAKRMVERKLGVALLPRTSVVRDVSAGRMRVAQIEGEPAIRRPIVAFRRRDVSLSPAASAFLQLAREAVESGAPGGDSSSR